jgi:CHAT domain-containing protein
MGREVPGLASMLTRAGRTDLLERYRQALEAYSGATASALRGNDMTSVAQRAWADYDTVAREIAAVAGVDLPGVQLTPAELAAAAAEGPVVYLAAADRSGYAIIVSVAGPPTYLALPRLTWADVVDLVESFLGGREPDWDKVATAARRLWTAGIDMLAADLPAGALVTLIPVGLLGLLPVHAAGGPTAPGQAPGEWEFLADRVTVRYAPNARTLLGTRHRAGALAQAPLTLLAVAAPDGDPRNRVEHTVREVTEIARRWTQVKLITDGASAALGELPGDDTVWHLACHCRTVPERILDSALLLSHAQVTLREILAMPSVPRRLAVLSACKTHVSGTELPDEAMGLPAGLLHAGFAGVIASHWEVSDRSTAFLMTRFHDLWHCQGLTPPMALAEAQRWLRGATRADAHAYLDGLPPEGLAQREADRPYRHPYYWAPFALTGH